MSSAIAPGTKLGRYEIRSLIGVGGMGEVYRARDPELGRDVAIKVLPKAFAADADRLRRFEQEARAAGTLNHPNILAVYDLGSRQGSTYVVTELLEGSTLRDELAAGALSQRRALDYARQIAEGLAAAHDKGVVHRDLKPDNLFITGDGRVKILDFGLAKLTQPRTSGSDAGPDAPTIPYVPDTEPGMLMGTVGYMSPEQVRAEPADHRSDIFSFGVVLYEMLAGRRAFQRDSAVETMGAILRDEPPDVWPAGASPSPALERVLRHCLEKRPEARFQSARDLAFNLDALSFSSTETPSMRDVGGAASSMPRRRDVVIGGALLAAGSTVAYLVGNRFGRRTVPAQPKFQRLTSRLGVVFTARFAPDDHTILYSALWQGDALQPYSTRPETPESRPLGLPDALLLAVSRSGELALLMRPKRPLAYRNGTLARMPITGGAPRELLDWVIDADWTPDGSDLAVTRSLEANAAASGARLEFPLGTVRLESNDIRFPRVSPTGDRVVVDDGGSIVVIDRAGAKMTLATEQHGVDGLAWSPDGEEVWYVTSEVDFTSPIRQVNSVSIRGRKRLILRTIGLDLLDVARDGRALFRLRSEAKGIAALASGESRERDLSWLGYDHVADISPDGTTVLFTERWDSVYLRRIDGSPAIRLGDGIAHSLSPDGRRALVDQSGRIVLLPTGAGEARVLLEENSGCAVLGWFPDSTRLLVECTEAGQTTRAYAQSTESRERRPLTPPGMKPVFRPSPDGALILAADPGGAVWIMPIDGSERRPLPRLDAGEELVQWSADGRALYVRQGTGERVRVERVDLKTGRRELWRELVPDPWGSAAILPLVMTPDARAYAYTNIRNASELYLVTGLV
jgi:Tol biopolymer transport system component